MDSFRKDDLMPRSIQWASKLLLATLVTSIVLVGLGQAAHAGATSTAPAQRSVAATAPAPVATSGVYTVELWPDGSMTVQTTNYMSVPNVGDPTAGEFAPLASWTHRFSQTTTRLLWRAVLDGSTATIFVICTAAPLPAWVEAIGCAVIAGRIRDAMDALGNPNGRCLEMTISTRLGIPPWRISFRYVTC